MLGLTQTIQVVTATVIDVRGVPTADWNNATEVTAKAHVFYESTGLDDRGSGPGLVLTRQLTAIMEVLAFDPKFTRIRWQDGMYSVQPPMVREYNRRPMFQSVAMSAL